MIKFKLALLALTVAIWAAYYINSRESPKEMTQDLQKCEAAIYKVLDNEAHCLEVLKLYKDRLNSCEDLLEEAGK